MASVRGEHELKNLRFNGIYRGFRAVLKIWETVEDSQPLGYLYCPFPGTGPRYSSPRVLLGSQVLLEMVDSVKS